MYWPLIWALGFLGLAGGLSGTFDNTQSTVDSGPPLPGEEDEGFFDLGIPNKIEMDWGIPKEITEREYIIAGLIAFGLLSWASK